MKGKKRKTQIPGATGQDFQVFVKPVGPACNLGCAYCYYLEKEQLFSAGQMRRMEENLLEKYIADHIDAAKSEEVSFSWHGGEPTLAGLAFFEKIVSIQKRLNPKGKRITNGIQTNGTLLDEAWCRFFSLHEFTVGLSLDGPRELHDRFRKTKGGGPTHQKVMQAYDLLTRHGVHTEILSVINAHNVNHPLRVYRFFKKLGARYISFLPLVEKDSGGIGGVSDRTVPAKAFGEFLCLVFDEWKARDIGRINVQVFDEAAQTASGREHALCIFRETCGDIPVVEHNGDFYSCDHHVGPDHLVGNVWETPLRELLGSQAQKNFGTAKRDTLPRYCRECDVLGLCNGECPKNRFIMTPDGEEGLNYLCEGYRMFFRYCKPFVAQLAALWKQSDQSANQPDGGSQDATKAPKTGRNDPCPCGSGKKYKKCCLSTVGS